MFNRASLVKIVDFWFAYIAAPFGKSASTLSIAEWNANPLPPACFKLWFMVNEETDRQIKDMFDHDLRSFSSLEAYSKLTELTSSDPIGLLGAVILFDQFSRNIYRNTLQMFAFDSLALPLAKHAIASSIYSALPIICRSFLLLPFQHSEDLADQTTGINLYKKLIDDTPEILRENMMDYYKYAVKHYDIIAKFGRFPHRNRILGRQSTDEEIEYLKNAETFGVAA